MKIREKPSRRRLINQTHGDEFAVTTQHGDDYVITILRGVLLLRPKGSRRGGKAEVAAHPGVIYYRAFEAKLAASRTPRRRSRR